MEVWRRSLASGRVIAGGVCGGGASAAHVGLARHSPYGSCVPPIVASTHSHATHETVAVGTVAAACVLGRAHRWHGNERAELRHGRACDAHHRTAAGRSGRGRPRPRAESAAAWGLPAWTGHAACWPHAPCHPASHHSGASAARRQLQAERHQDVDHQRRCQRHGHGRRVPRVRTQVKEEATGCREAPTQRGGVAGSSRHTRPETAAQA